MECVRGLLDDLQSTAAPCRDPPPLSAVEASSLAPVTFNPNAFLDSGSSMNEAVGQKMRQRKVKSIEEAVSACGNAEEQLLAFYGYLQKNQNKVAAVKTAVDSIRNPNVIVGIDVLSNMRDIIKRADETKRRGDSKTFLQTMLVAVTGSKVPNKKAMVKLADALGIKKSRALAPKFKQAVAARRAIMDADTADTTVKLVQQYQFKKSY